MKKTEKVESTDMPHAVGGRMIDSFPPTETGLRSCDWVDRFKEDPELLKEYSERPWAKQPKEVRMALAICCDYVTFGRMVGVHVVADKP